METQKVLKKGGKIAGNILLYLFIAICLLGVILAITSKKDDDGTATIFGKQLRFVLSPSMEKCDATDVSGFEIKDIPTKSVVFIDTVPEDEAKAAAWYADLKVGDVLTFKYAADGAALAQIPIRYMVNSHQGALVMIKATEGELETTQVNLELAAGKNVIRMTTNTDNLKVEDLKLYR